MKAKTHPVYNVITVTCACGNSFQTRSTRASFTVDICSACHPFYTGKQKTMDIAGKIENFKRKYAGFDMKAVTAAQVGGRTRKAPKAAEAAAAPARPKHPKAEPPAAKAEAAAAPEKDSTPAS